VTGNGGYYHLHGMNAEDGSTDEETGAHLVKSNHKAHGYVTLTVDGQNISGTVTTVSETNDGQPTSTIDEFQYPVGAQFLPEGLVVSL